MTNGRRDDISDPMGPTPIRPRIFSGSALLAGVLVVSILIGGALAVYHRIAAGLPETIDLKSYHPKSASAFYAEDGSVLSRFYTERRFPVTLDAVPKHVQAAFIAAEDTRFYSHPGVDPEGILRALVKDLMSWDFAQGGSTITQQLARSMLLTREKTISRKLREVILALRIERSNSKAQILETYLNEVYLGRGAYGIEAAARAYFGKKTADLTISEAAYLAGLVQNPAKYGPGHPDKAEARRKYVLAAMLKMKSISKDQYKKALQEKPAFVFNTTDHGVEDSYFTEAVRRYIISKYGEQTLYEGGIQVWTTVDKHLQAKAEKAVVKGVKAWEKRQRRPAGLVKRLDPAEIQDMKSSPSETNLKPGDSLQAVVVSGSEMTEKSKSPGGLYELAVMAKGGQIYKVRARSDIPYHKNDLLAFKVKEIVAGKPILEHQSLPPVQGALVSIENSTGYIRALVGGTGEDKAGFNRALQALRQPGSAFKPVVYSAALEWGGYDPRTVILDEPIAVKMGGSVPDWIPENPDGNFQGPMTLSRALVKSRNIPAVKVMMDLGPEAVIQIARNMGIKSPVGDNLSSALGASEATPLEMTSAYTVFPNMGVRVTPVMIKKITDQAGNVLEDNTVTPLNVVRRTLKDVRKGVCVPAPKTLERKPEPAEGEGDIPAGRRSVCEAFETGRPNKVRAMSPRTAYIMLRLLREVTVSGTASSARRMHRPDIGGKTGSTNDYSDAWFIGFNPKYTTGVWIGYDNRTSLGPKEFGAKAALPVWMDYMSYALRAARTTSWPFPPSSARYGRQQGASAEDFLSSSPQLPATAGQIKRVSPVDVVSPPSFANPWNYSMWGGPATYGIFSYPGLIRVLSRRGKTIGMARYVRDANGNLTVQEIPRQVFNPDALGPGR